MATKNFSIAATPSLTITLTIKRKSDNYYWTGSVWQASAATCAMTEVASLASGYSEYYSETAPTSPCFWWAIDSGDVLWDKNEYDPTQTTSATSSSIAPETADIKAALPMDSADTVDDTLLGDLANRAGENVEQYCGRLFASSERSYVLDGPGNARLYLHDWPITSIASIYVCVDMPRNFTATGGSHDSSELVDSDYYQIGGDWVNDETKNHIVNISGSWGKGNRIIEVIATTGYATMPADLYQASIEVAVYLYNAIKHRRLGLTSQSMEGGNVGYDFERGIPKQTRDVLNRYKTGLMW